MMGPPPRVRGGSEGAEAQGDGEGGQKSLHRITLGICSMEESAGDTVPEY